LDISAEKAEAIISDMVTENRIKAQLDQLTSSVDFEVQIAAKGVQVAGGQGANAPADGAADNQALAEARGPTDAERELHDFNSAIHSVCANIDSLIADIVTKHPDL